MKLSNIPEKKGNLLDKQTVLQYIQEYDRFLYKIAFSVQERCQRLEIEDIKQQIILTLLLNYNKFDKRKNIRISSYFSQIAINAANNIAKKYWQEKNRVNIECVSLDAFINKEETYQYLSIIKEDESSFLYPNNYFKKNEFEDKINYIGENLNSFEKKVFTLYLNGMEIKSIAKKLKRSSKTIYNILSFIKEKIKNILK